MLFRYLHWRRRARRGSAPSAFSASIAAGHARDPAEIGAALCGVRSAENHSVRSVPPPASRDRWSSGGPAEDARVMITSDNSLVPTRPTESPPRWGLRINSRNRAFCVSRAATGTRIIRQVLSTVSGLRCLLRCSSAAPAVPPGSSRGQAIRRRARRKSPELAV